MTEHKTIAAALVAFQAELPDVSKGSTNPAFKSRYADLADVTKAVFPVLAKHGLAFIARPDQDDTGLVLRYSLIHASGERLDGVWPLPDGAKAQELGSWITYGRRYCLSAVTGITPDADDDGNAATSAARNRPVRATPADASAAAAAIAAAPDHAELRRVEGKAHALGIAGVPVVRDALAAKHAELGASPVDEWATVGVAP